MTAQTAEVVPLLPPNRMKPAEAARNRWRVIAEESHSKEQIMNPAYWAHASQKIRAGDIIEVVNDTETFFMELYVKQVERGYAHVIELKFVSMEVKIEETKSPDYKVVYKGPHKKFCVIRNQDDEAIKSEMSKQEAHTWLAQYLKQINDRPA